MKIEPDPRALELLRSSILGQLGYVGLDGYPRVVAVWFDYAGGELLIGSRPGEYKCRSLRANPRAALTASTPAWPYVMVTAVGEAVVETLPEDRRKELIGRLCHRYLGQERGDRYYEMWSQGGHPGEGELVRLRPTRIRFHDISG
jgi:PPOX class probable F420-dependent enzyme